MDVYKIRVMVENDASIPVASTYEVQDVTPLPSAEETAEKPMVTPTTQPVAIPATEPEQKPKVPDTFISPEDDEDDERPLHQRLFGTPEQPAFVPAPPEVTEAPEADEVEAARMPRRKRKHRRKKQLRQKNPPRKRWTRQTTAKNQQNNNNTHF